MKSRLSIYLHPLAGRPLCWHALQALIELGPAPGELTLIADPELPLDLLRDLEPRVRTVPSLAAFAATVRDDDTLLVADAAAPALDGLLGPLLHADGAAVLAAPGGEPAAVRMSGGAAAEFFRTAAPGSWADALRPELPRIERPEALVVHDRAALSRAGAYVRDRTVARLMAGGTTFLLPQTTLVDVDVRIGRDSVIYPGVVLEGQTTIGDETVIGPCTRIVDSWVGSGVEMKGWNHVSRTSIRNRAILEPYVRRGFE